MDVLLAVVGEVGFSWEVASENAVGVLDGAALPGRMGIAEPGFHVQGLREVLMSGEFGSIVEGDGAARELGQALEDIPQEPVRGLGCLAPQRGGQGETRDSLDQRQEIAVLGAELQEVALPVAEFLTPIDDLWSLMDGAAAGDRFSTCT